MGIQKTKRLFPVLLKDIGSLLVILVLLLFFGMLDSNPRPVRISAVTSSSSTPASALPATETPPAQSTKPDLNLSMRLAMVENTIANRGVVDELVLHAMRTVPRHLFVPDEYIDLAYTDSPLPIGYGQTISQPYVVAWMTQLLELGEGERVLEIGTGSGYQAAVLAEMGIVDVYSIEIIPELTERAQAILTSLGYTAVKLKNADGYYGWDEFAPFDAMIVTAAPDHLPATLVHQLAENGRLVIPIGPVGGFQTLWKFVKQGEDIRAFNLGLVRFVPLTGEGVSSGGNKQ